VKQTANKHNERRNSASHECGKICFINFRM
jgi:hypothetical protein